MNPDDVFIPQGVPYDAKRTPILPSTAPPHPHAGTQVILDETDDLGITTVILHGVQAEANLGIALRHVPHTGLVLDEFPSDSVLKGTHLHPTMNILSINGCDCSCMSVEESVLLITSTVGELTLRAVHAQILLWPDSNNHTSSMPRSSSRAVAPPNNATSTALVVPSTNALKETAPPPMVKVTIQKPSKRSAIGLSVGNYETFPVITKIDPEGLCANTCLRVGMRVWSVNGLRCYTKDDTTTKWKRAKGTCYIEAQQVVDLGSDLGSATTTRKSLVRSLSPKNWLPTFKSRRSIQGSAEAEQLVLAETEQFASRLS